MSRAEARMKKELPYDPIYLNDYTQIPRGRVFFREGNFSVFVGSWITSGIKKKLIKTAKKLKINQ